MKKIYVLLGGSGVGKSRTGNLLAEYGVPKVVTTTTRDMREGEVEGVDYYFTDVETFKTLQTIEHTFYVGNYYGITAKAINDALCLHDIIHVVTDIVGVKALREIYGDMVEVIFITVPLEVMAERMRDRGDSEVDIENRINKAVETDELTNPCNAEHEIQNINWEDTKRKILDIISWNEKKLNYVS